MIKLDIKIPVRVFEEDDVWVAHCPGLDVASQGNTAPEAKAGLIDAVTAFLLTCYDMGTLVEVLKDCGFEHIAPRNMAELSANDAPDMIDIPLPFIIDKTPDPCHA